MRIHSSSLSLNPVGFKTNNIRGETEFTNDSIKNASFDNQTSSPLIPLNKIEKQFKGEDLQKLSATIKSQNNTQTNSRTNVALDAYIIESNQALENQLSGSISEIDFFA